MATLKPFTGELDPQPELKPFSGQLDGEKPKPAGMLRRVADQGIKLAQGVVGVPETAVGLADLVSNGQAGKLVEGAGVRFKDAKSIMGEYLSPEQKAADAAVQKAEGFFPTVGAMLQNPSTIVGGAVESAPSMLVGGIASRGLLSVAPKIGAIAAGAAGEGIVTAGQNAEQLRQEDANGTLTPRQSAIMAGSGLLTGLISGGQGALANKLGIGDVQTMLARGKLGAVGAEAQQAAAGKGMIRKIGEGIASEGVLQELPQSYQEQVAQNIAQNKPWDEGAAKAGAHGMMAGALMGGGANAASHFAEQPTTQPQPVQPGTPPAQPGTPPKNQPPVNPITGQAPPSVSQVTPEAVPPVSQVTPDQSPATAAPVATPVQAEVQKILDATDGAPGPLASAAIAALNTGATPVAQPTISAFDQREADRPRSIEGDIAVGSLGQPLTNRLMAAKAARAKSEETGTPWQPIELGSKKYVIRPVAQDGATNPIQPLTDASTLLPSNQPGASVGAGPVDRNGVGTEPAGMPAADVVQAGGVPGGTTDKAVAPAGDTAQPLPDTSQLPSGTGQLLPGTGQPVESTKSQGAIQAGQADQQVQEVSQKTAPIAQIQGNQGESSSVNDTPAAKAEQAPVATDGVAKLNDGIKDNGVGNPDWYSNGYPWETGIKVETAGGVSQDGSDILKGFKLYSGAGMKLRDAIRHAEIYGKPVPQSAYDELQALRKPNNTPTTTTSAPPGAAQQPAQPASVPAQSPKLGQLPPVAAQLIQTGIDAASDLRDRVSKVSLGELGEKYETIAFEFDGETHTAELKGRNRDLVVYGDGRESDKGIAVRAMLDGDSTVDLSKKQQPAQPVTGQGAGVSQPTQDVQWDSMTPDAKTDVLKRAGWRTNAGGLNVVGKNLLKKKWADIVEGTQATITKNIKPQQQGNTNGTQTSQTEPQQTKQPEAPEASVAQEPDDYLPKGWRKDGAFYEFRSASGSSFTPTQIAGVVGGTVTKQGMRSILGVPYHAWEAAKRKLKDAGMWDGQPPAQTSQAGVKPTKAENVKALANKLQGKAPEVKPVQSSQQEKLDALPYLPIRDLKVGDEFQADQTSRRAKTGGTITSIGPVNVIYSAEYMGKPMEGLKIGKREITLVSRDGVLFSTKDTTSNGEQRNKVEPAQSSQSAAPDLASIAKETMRGETVKQISKEESDRLTAENMAATEKREQAAERPEVKRFYVTMIRGNQVARLAGPFDTKEQAEAMVDRAREEANKADPRSAFDAFGVTGVAEGTPKPGVLNKQLGIDAAGKPAAITQDDVESATNQALRQIEQTIDNMKADAVQRIAVRFLPTMGIKTPIGKARIKAALSGPKANLLAAAAEFGVDLPASIKRALEAKDEGRVDVPAEPAQPANDEPSKSLMPSFNTYSEANDWAKGRAKSLDITWKEYNSTPEYKDHVYPALQALYSTYKAGWDAENIETGKQLQKAMKDAGVSPGDTVKWSQVGSFLSQTDYQGIVKLDSLGVPYVHLSAEIAVSKPGGRIGYAKKIRWQPYMSGVKAQPAESKPAAQEPVNANESLNKRHSINKESVLTPAGSLKADATNSKADSSVWYYQGDMEHLQFAANTIINGEPDPRAADAKKLLKQIKVVRASGWSRRNIRAGSLGTVWVYEKDGKFLTNAGMENADNDVMQRPELPQDGAGYEKMVRRQFAFAKAFNDWLETLPQDQQANRAVVSRKLGDTPIGQWARIEDDSLWGVNVKYYDKDALQFSVVLGYGAGSSWDQARNYIAGLAKQYEASKTAESNDLRAMLEKAKDGPISEPMIPSDSSVESPGAAPNPDTILDLESSLWSRITDGKATVDEFKAGFERWVKSKDAIIEAFSKMKKDELLKMGGSVFGYRNKSENKSAIVDAMWRDGANSYVLGRSFMHGMGKNAWLDGIRAMVDNTDADQLAQYAADRKADQEEAVARVAKMSEAIKDPQTLDDYKTWMRATMTGGKTFKEARMMLTVDQRATFDDLVATESRSSRKKKTADQRTSVSTAGQAVESSIIATKHTKKGHDLFVVKLGERVSKEDYSILLAGAKRIGGYYSAFRGAGAIPGFQFTERSQAEAFEKLAKGDNTAAQEAAQASRDAFADDRSQTAVQRLTEMADRLEEQANASLNQDRKQNTDKRARQAASAEAAASADKAMAKTMRNLAQSIGSGSAKFLDRVRQKTQVSMLLTAVKNAKYEELRTKYPAYADQERHKGEPATIEAADYAEYPGFTAYRSDLASLARQLVAVDGTKKIGQQLLKVADDVSDAYLKFAKENFSQVASFSKTGGGVAGFNTKDAAEAAIARSGYKGKAIAYQVKRGEYTVIISPSEAIDRGIWKGDGDKRITLSVEFGTELVEKIGKASRRGSPVSVPWQLETAHDRIKALERMGIETPAEYRAALREFIGLQEVAEAPNKVKQLERAMVGRRNDGLDFFPTPESVADEMVEAAGIEPGMAVLEPSAGWGHIAERIRVAGVDPDVGEMSGERRELLEAKGFNVVGRDFMEMSPRGFYYGDVFKHKDGRVGILGSNGGLGSSQYRLYPMDGDRRNFDYVNRDDLTGVEKRGTSSGYDRILMNPPFSDGRDIQHVQHAYGLLRPGGRIVAIMGESSFTNQNKKATEFRAWLDSVGGTSEKLAEGSFSDPSLPVNTGANARMVVIDKETDTGVAMFSRATTTKPTTVSALQKAVRQLTGRLTPTSKLGHIVATTAAEIKSTWEPLIDKRINIDQTGNEGKAQAFFDPKTKTIFLIADNIEAGTETAVLAHELVHKHGKPVLGEIGWSDLHSVIESWSNAAEGTNERKVYDFAAERVNAIGAELSSEELFPYAVEAAFRLGIKPNAIARTGTVAKWLAKVKQALREVWDKVVGNPKTFDSQDLVNLAYGVAQREMHDVGPVTGGGMEPILDIRNSRKVDQTDTPAFKAWFGDSKVVDANGKPLVVYHGTYRSFSVFDVSAKKQTSLLNDGVFNFSSNPKLANTFARDIKTESKAARYWQEAETDEESDEAELAMQNASNGGNVMPVYINMQHPIIIEKNGEQLKNYSYEDGMDTPDAMAIDDLKLGKYDGVIFRDALDNENVRGDIYVVANPTQIKSAIGNRGTFDPANPDIRYSRSPNNLRDGLSAATVTDVKRKFWNRLSDFRPLALQGLGRRQLVEIYEKLLPQLKAYDKRVSQMDADKNESSAEADTLVTSWGKLKDELQLAELMHDATLAQIDPSKEFRHGDDVNFYEALKSGYDALSPESKATYLKARDMYKAHHAKVREAIRERIERSILSSEKKQRLLEKMDGEFFKKVKGVYFPLSRFGQYLTIVRDENGGVLNVSRSETMNEAEETRRILLREYPASGGFQVGKVLKQREFNAVRDGVGRGFMADLFDTLESSGVGEDVQDAISQLYLASLPDLSWAKHGIHRKGTPGFSQDARRAFAQNMFHGGNYLAKLRHADQLQTSLTDMQEYIDNQQDDEAYESVKAQQVLDEMVKRHDSLMNPQSNPISTALTSFGFVFHLGLSPASAVVNLTQTALVAYPLMGAKWGFDKAGAALLVASKQAATNRNDISKILTGAELDAYKKAVSSGVIDVTQSHDLAGVSQGEDSKLSAKIRPVMKWASFMFHHAERFNRQVTFVAAYRLAKQAGQSDDAAFESAVKMTYSGHFDYAASNRARIMQGNVAKVVLLFKQYAQNVIYMFGRNLQQAINAESPETRKEARKALGGLLVAHALAAGAFGLPVVGTLLALASAIGGDDDEPWDAKVALQNMLADTFGQKPAEVMVHGLSRLTPWDISGRVGLDKLLLPDIQEGLQQADAVKEWMTAALGPVAGVAVNAGKGMQEMADGRYLKGLESMMPVALRNPLKSIRYGTEGNIDKSGIAINDEVGFSGVVGQFLGFSPSETRLAQEGKSAVLSADRKIQDRRSHLMRQYAMAVLEGDEQTKAETKDAIAAFNGKNPHSRINPLQLAQSVRARRLRIDQAKDGIYLPKKRQDAREAGRFALEDS